MRISDWSSDVCSSDLARAEAARLGRRGCACEGLLSGIARPLGRGGGLAAGWPLAEAPASAARQAGGRAGAGAARHNHHAADAGPESGRADALVPAWACGGATW